MQETENSRTGEGNAPRIGDRVLINGKQYEVTRDGNSPWVQKRGDDFAVKSINVKTDKPWQAERTYKLSSISKASAPETRTDCQHVGCTGKATITARGRSYCKPHGELRNEIDMARARSGADSNGDIALGGSGNVHKAQVTQPAPETRSYTLGQLIEVEWYNSTTKKNEWREAMFLHKHDAVDRPWRAEIDIDGRRVTDIAPECIRPLSPRPAPETSKLKLSKYGLAESPIGKHVSLFWKGRKLLGEVYDAQYNSTRGYIELSVKHFNGEDWPIKPVASAVEVIIGSDSATQPQPGAEIPGCAGHVQVQWEGELPQPNSAPETRNLKAYQHQYSCGGFWIGLTLPDGTIKCVSGKRTVLSREQVLQRLGQDAQFVREEELILTKPGAISAAFEQNAAAQQPAPETRTIEAERAVKLKCQAELERVKAQLNEVTGTKWVEIVDELERVKSREAKLLAALRLFVAAWTLPNNTPTGNCIGRNKVAYDAARSAIAAVEGSVQS